MTIEHNCIAFWCSIVLSGVWTASDKEYGAAFAIAWLALAVFYFVIWKLKERLE